MNAHHPTHTSAHRTARDRVRRVHRRGFRLIAVIVAVTIIALLAALVAPRFVGFLRTSTRRTAQIEVAALHKQVELYMIENDGLLPNDFDLIELTMGDDPQLNNEDDLIDPWGNPYYCEVDNPVYNIDFDVISWGADGQAGGEGDDADIISGQD